MEAALLQNVGNHLPHTQTHNPENSNMNPTISLATTQQLALIPVTACFVTMQCS